jgi:gliding motility-associated protein GldM
MAHEKLSPRQRMIGMMYLVLTAMLALNISKDTVKAFMKVDKSLNTTVENYIKKNNIIYNDFEASFAQFPEKTGPYRTKALEVKQYADQMYDFIQDLKIEIIKEADGPDAIAIDGRKIDIFKVKRYDDNNTPSQILIGSNEAGKAYNLKAAIDLYRKFLTESLEGKAPDIEESLKNSLNTEDGLNEDRVVEKWPNLTFQLLPLVGANALLTKMQVDVRNAETEVLNYLFAQIDKSNFKFNKLGAIVIPKSSYVTLGSSYEAQVFISASDSTQDPTITVGDQVLPLDESGKGIYSVRPSSTGVKSWGGVISLQAPDGTVKTYKTGTISYQVGESNATVSATAVNIMYAGIENPIDVSVPSVRPDRIKVKTNGTGTVTKSRVQNARTKEFFPGEWAVNPTVEPGNIVQVIVTGEDENGKPTSYPPKNFRVRNVPLAIAEFGGKSSGPISKGTATAMDEIFAVLKDFEFDLQYKVTGFTMNFPGNFGTVPKTSASSKLTAEQKSNVAKMTRGQKLIIEEITARNPAGKIVGLAPIVLTID